MRENLEPWPIIGFIWFYVSYLVVHFHTLYVSIYIYVCMYMYVYVYIYMYVYVYICIYIYVYVYMYIYIYVSPVPGSPHPPNGMVSCPLTPPSKPSICMLFAALQHLGDSLPYFENHNLVSGPLSSCVSRTYQSSTYYPKPVYVLPIAYLTHGLPLIVYLYAT